MKRKGRKGINIPLRLKTRLKRKQIGKNDTITNKIQKTMKKKIYKYMASEKALFVRVILAALCLQISILMPCVPLIIISYILLLSVMTF